MMDTWIATRDLRWINRPLHGDYNAFDGMRGPILQQMWVDPWGKTEWRDVPLVTDE